MSRRPFVSVVIPFFNAERFLAEAVESVFAQTYGHWELLLVDDGSTDTGATIARQVSEKFAGKVSHLAHDGRANRGTCASRNLAIRRARGELIALLDADDVWLPHKLERQVAILEAHPDAALVYGATQYWRSWNRDGVDTVPDLGVETNVVMKPPALLRLAAPIGHAITPCPSDLMFRRDMITRVGGFEEAFRGIYQLYEDRAFLTKVYLHESVFVARECWDRYRQHPDSCVSRVTTAGRHHAARLFFLNWLERYLAVHGVDDREILEGLHRALWPYRHPILDRLQRRTQRYTAPARTLLMRDRRAPRP
jgi:glycosyltransferase involved in cell wall biosynthesis